MESRFSQADFPSRMMRDIAASYDTPLYVYSEKVLKETARKALSFPNLHGLTVRYAMKALPTKAILQIFEKMGLAFDASSGYEVLRAENAGIPSSKITLTAQELPPFFANLVERGVDFNACSLNQLNEYGNLFPGTALGVRVNPGLGSGHTNRTNTGGPASSFGIWHEELNQVKELAARHKLKIKRVHSHIGAGTEPDIWVRCAKLTLKAASFFSEIDTVSLGGGFKVARMPEEDAGDLLTIGKAIEKEFQEFESKHGATLHLEIEPGTFLVANAGILLTKIVDIVSTGSEGYRFLKVDSGMTEILRPSLYGAQHPIWVLDQEDGGDQEDFLVVGHCCESGDIFTPEPGNPDGLKMRRLLVPVLGELLAVGGAGAYCSGMSAKNYNSFPEAAEALLLANGSHKLIRRRQTLHQITENEV